MEIVKYNLQKTSTYFNAVTIFFFLIQFHIVTAQNNCGSNPTTIIPAELGIIPWPQSLTENLGTLSLTTSSDIVYADPSLQTIANILKDDINKVIGLNLAVRSGTANAGDVGLSLNNTLQNEGYILNVTTKIEVTGKDYQAVVWGISSLLQALNSDGSINKIQINDVPDTGYRGLMVDLARQWHPVDNIQDIINMCRLYKINYLHLHFTDSDSFTFPSQAYPLLPTPGRSYTLAELQELEAYSQARGVTIIPELEVPGHAAKMIQAYPNLFGSGTGGAINFARADVRAAVGTLVSEFAAVFQATPYFHIGCDEVDRSGMSTHPDYINAITTLGVGDVEGLFNYFISEISGYVKAEGKRALAWEGFDAGRTGNAKVDTDVIVCPFDNYTSADVYANNGYDILNTSWFPLYLIGSTYVPIEKIYDWELTDFGRYATAFPFSHNNPYQYTMSNTGKLIGAQTCSWEQKADWEISSLRSRVSPMVKKIWNTNARRTYSDYQERFAKSDAVLQKILSTSVPEAITPSVSYDVFADKIKILWRANDQYPFNYTLYRSSSNNSATAIPILSNTTATSFDDTTVSIGQTYFYWIKANNSIDESVFGNSAKGRTGASNLVNAYESFDYNTNTSLSSTNGGTGFSGGWTIVDKNGIAQIINSSLSYPNLVTSGNSLTIDMNGESGSFTAERSLTGNLCPEGSVVWLSFLVFAEKVGDGHSFFILGDKSVGKKWGNGIYFSGTNAQLAYKEGETNLIVLKIESFNGSDNVHIWTNPEVNGTEPNVNDPNCYFTDREDLGTNPRLRLNTQHHGEGRYIYDEFRVGDSFDDVLPAIIDTGGSVDCDDDISDATCVNACLNGLPETTILKPKKDDLVLGEKRILFMRGQDTAFPYNATDAQIQTFEDSLKYYISRISHGKASIADFDITPIYNIDVSKPYYQRSDDMYAIAAQTYNMNDYDVYVFCDRGDLAGAGGLGSNDGAKGRLWLNTNLLYYYKGDIHEMIHAFGPGHAEGIEGGNEIWPGTVTGGHDPYYFMGSEGNAGLQADIPAWMKYWLGWIEDDNIIIQDAKPSCSSVHRIYKHAELTTIEPNRKISIQLGQELWISYEPDTYNDRIVKTGVLLHNVPPQSPAITRLLDTSPSSISNLPSDLGSNWAPVIDLWDAAMATGDQVNWQGTNISVLAEGGSGENKWVDIEICNCIAVSGDTDNDGICNELDACEGFDDAFDTDGDGIPDDCDDCPLSFTNDLNSDNICDNEQCIQEATEAFNYPVNSTITGANGGVGFSNAWDMQNIMNGSIEVESGSLSYPNISRSGNKLKFTMQDEDASKWISRNLAYSFQQGDEVWISCLIKPIVRADGGFWIKPNGRQDIAIGKRWGSQLAIDNNGSSVNVVANTVYKLDVRYKLENNQTVVHLWINRFEDFTDANADAAKTIGAIADIRSIGISMERWGNGVVEIDELVVGCSNPNCNVDEICDDGDACTTGETYDAYCNCNGGIIQDADSDGVCDANDMCPAGDDNLDINMDGVPDDCYICLDVINDINTPNILYDREADISISTNGRVLSGANVQYHAGQQIELMSGFEVELGAEFHVYIAPCD